MITYAGEPNRTKVVASDMARMYLMFKPAGDASQWVPLRMLYWEWCGIMEKKALQEGLPKIWQPVIPFAQNKADNSLEMSDHPQWTHCVPQGGGGYVNL